MSDLIQRLIDDRVASRTWRRETTVFARPDAAAGVHDAIRQRLGWLDAPDTAPAALAGLTDFARDVRAGDLDHVYLLGMGGSSLCAEVLRDTPSVRTAPLALTVLDTTDERAVRHATDALVAERALFLVASKSGTTLEVAALEQHFWSEVSRLLGADAGAHFAAITDPATPLVALAADRGYRRVFVNPPDIGGRYSVLSLFGLVPAALLGLDLSALVESSRSMAAACREDSAENPGLALGAFIAEHALAGRDKLTLLLPEAWRPLGAWIEQLVAESTGKEGRGVLPIVDEPAGDVSEYAEDRTFVAVTTPDAGANAALLQALEEARRPRDASRARTLGARRRVLPLGVRDRSHGRCPGRQSVRRAQRPRGQDSHRSPTHRAPHDRALPDRTALRPSRRLPAAGAPAAGSRPDHEDAAGSAPSPRPYLALLDYLPSDPRRADLIARLRSALRAHDRTVTTYGIGPRYLHSTGQYHKGGPNTGRFVLLTAADASATPVPTQRLHVQRPQAGAGARRLRRARRRRTRCRALPHRGSVSRFHRDARKPAASPLMIRRRRVNIAGRWAPIAALVAAALAAPLAAGERCLVAADAPAQAPRQAHARLFPPNQLGLLEAPDRDEWQQPERIMDVLSIAERSRVADLGAGGGWFTIRLARRVGPHGLVIAEDVQREMIESVQRRVKSLELNNVETRLGTAEDPRLPGDLHAVLMVDTFPQIADPVSLLRHVARALTPNWPTRHRRFPPRRRRRSGTGTGRTAGS